MVLDHNSCLFLSQALWPPQTYRAYLSIVCCWPQPHMCPLDTLYNDLSHKQCSLSAPLRQLFDVDLAHIHTAAELVIVRMSKCCFTHIHSHGHARLSKQPPGSRHCIYTCSYNTADFTSYCKCHCLCS